MFLYGEKKNISDAFEKPARFISTGKSPTEKQTSILLQFVSITVRHL